MRSVRSDRRMARTAAIGLRREPQPPMPIVIPLRELADQVVERHPLVSHGRLPTCVRVGVALLHERRPLLVGHPGDVELVGEALLESVAAPRRRPGRSR